MSLGQLTFRLVAEQGLRFQSFSGFAVRGVLFDFLKRVDEQLALKLHSEKAIAPYSVTPVEVLWGQYSSFVFNRLDKPAMVQFRISVFESGLMDVLTQALLSAGSPSVRLVDADTPIAEVQVNQISFEKILEEAKPVRRFEVLFRTPCYFRRSVTTDSSNPVLKNVRPPYRAVPLPEASLMFRNLARIWRRFSGMSLDYRDYVSWVDRGGVALAGFPSGIRTIRVYEHPKSNKWAMGFVGAVRFSIPGDMFTEKHARFTDALMRMAEYSNVGGNRTAGFGVVKYFPKDSS
ncbi:MAG: CRISPR system precrRNA processing endoribonuclease RAMP protein Cas6 [Candidatus Brockarchaeota archaeon]|nr:CRISPR system precrRNA processing endoribonuclease RAMP protein Cas6 [Candidatus Brockarchaeota archaeon]